MNFKDFDRKDLKNMSDKELKPKSFRIDDLTAERFRKIAEETGGNQQQTLARLIDIYETQKSQEELPQKRADIDQMDEYLQAIRLKYLGILADNVHQEEIMKAKLAARMEKQDTEMEALKKQIQEAKQSKESMAREMKKITEKLNQITEELQNARTQLADKEKLNQELQESKQKLQESCVSLQDQIKSMRETIDLNVEKNKEIYKEMESIQNKFSYMQKEKKNLEDQLEQEKVRTRIQEQQAEIQLGRALLEQEKSFQEQNRRQTADNLSEISRYQQMYRELLDQMKALAAATNTDQTAGSKTAEPESAESESSRPPSASAEKENLKKES